MKKLLMLSALALVTASPAAFADHGKDGSHKGRMFEKLDADGDGVITREEFNKAGEERFKKMDADGDGKVTKEEAQAAAEKWHAKMKEHRQERMESHHDMQSSDDTPAAE